MVIKNAKIFREGGVFENGDIAIDGEFFTVADSDIDARCAAKASDCAARIDAQGCFAIPGLIDLHFHGCVGYDFSTCDMEGIEKMARFQGLNGVTSICPATLTLPEERISEACKLITASAKAFADPAGQHELHGCAQIVGIHLEGPFFSYNKRGAQNPDHLRLPDSSILKRLIKETDGLVKIVSIAPELDGAFETIKELCGEMRFSVGHTEADYETAKRAFENGARHVTHLYNGMPPFTHRQPSVVGAARDFPECSVELICDNVHIHGSAVRATFAMFGDERIIMVSDSIMATGLEDGVYDLGGLEVEVKEKNANLKTTGSLAGSVTTLMGCLKTAVTEMDIPLTSAVKACTENPAIALGIFDKYGSIAPGKYANLVLLNEDLTVKKVILKGKSAT